MASSTHLQILNEKRERCSSIARSRKRKLRSLYAVATNEDGIPNISFQDPDATPINAAESRFLEGCDILQGRKLDELNIPPRPRRRYEIPRQPTPSGPYVLNENAPSQVVAKLPVVDGPSVANQAASTPERMGPTEVQNKTVLLQKPQVNVIPATEASKTSFGPTAKTIHSQSDPAKAGSSSARPNQLSSHKQISAIQTQPLGQDGLLKGNKTDNGSRDAPQPLKPQEHPPRTALTSPDAPQPGQSNLDRSDTASREGSERKEDEQSEMEVDEPVERAATEVAPLFLHISQQDARPLDVLSSPGSTAQTATTPAVLDTSTNTSPDHDGMQYMERAEDAVEAGKPRDINTPTPPNLDAAEQNGTFVGSSREVEAQLLRDSADAAKTTASKTTDATISESHGKASEPVLAEPPVPPETEPTAAEAAGSLTKDDVDTIMTEVPNQPASEERPDKCKDLETPEGMKEQSKPRIPQASSSIPQHADRAVTRVSTGAIRQKSVSEILSGDHPKGVAASRSSDSEPHIHAPITPTSQSPRPRSRSLIEKARSKDKSKLSTVVFGKQPRKSSDGAKSVVQTHPTPSQQLSDDYFTPLFVQGYSNGQKWMKPLEQILHHAHKTVSTPDSYTQILDNQACKVLRRVYQLQHADKWSLRQPKRCPEPSRQESHWDVVLREMKWMRTDFREEGKWKRAVARNLASACADWVALKDYPEEQRELQVNAAFPRYPPRPTWIDGDLEWDKHFTDPNDGEEQDVENHPNPPDLVPSAGIDSPLEQDDEPHENILDTVAPSAIFALESDDVVFGLHHSPNTDRLLDELPMYGSPLKVPNTDMTALGRDPDSRWKRDVLPISKYVEGRIELVSKEPPRKKSRYQYAQEDDDEEVLFSQQSSTPAPLEPQNPHVALFQPANKAIRDRLHAGHQFRPPNEHTMPLQAFYESRSCSQWTVSEDDELKGLVREYSYNWSLISSMLSTKSSFTSGAERRTPWECFERWVMLEGLPHDMQKTQYFKLWQTRIDAAQQVIRQQNQNALAQQAQQQQQAGPNGPVTPVVRRRLSLPLKVERRRNQKHLTMIDAMRKLAKKRETAIQKQQHAAGLAAMRKAQEQPQPRTGPTKTPREYSIMRWERDQAMAERLAERMAQQQQRAEAQRRVRPTADSSSSNANSKAQATMQARAQQGHTSQLAAGQNAQMPQNPAQIGATHPLANMARAGVPNQMAVNGQARPRMPGQAAPNGNMAQGHIAGTLVPPMQMNGNGQVQMPVVNGQNRVSILTQPDLGLVLQAQRISEQQRHAVQMRQAQQQTHGMQQANATLQNSPPAMRAAMANGVNQKNYMSNNAHAMIASFSNGNGSGMSTPPASGLNMPAGQSGSPRPPAAMPQQIHQTYVSQLQHIESQIRQSNPNTPQDMVREMAKQLLQNRHNNLAQSAMNAAAGSPGQTAIANGPHQYAQLLRAQQQAQAAQAQQQVAQHQRNSSGSATPPVPSVPK
ncbi:uncharacterized protein BCR38DRAFT_481107 [Pseudomassariella vexata]|uniref:Vacuolar import and degradation protein 21 n=1 Tax=Pseudomassariella vexata TaxID=1141098 RepID=A0A1Y2EEF9_9PEZI|nr:uncharacterized protein BCR38DRAFT_481107 [Pseudomassariella vexata]ORY69950.1 hypothetical protein BCR38DRAFT_481107 [Pseudomassariella vexata]